MFFSNVLKKMFLPLTSLLPLSPDESILLEQMPLVMRTAIGVDVNFATFDKIALFQVNIG